MMFQRLLVLLVLPLVAFSSSQEQQREGELISIHDLTSGETLDVSRLRFKKVKSRASAGECGEGEMMVKITKFDDSRLRGTWLWIFDKDVDYRLTASAGGVTDTKAKIGTLSLSMCVQLSSYVFIDIYIYICLSTTGNNAVGVTFCLKVDSLPPSVTINAACERKWFPEGNFGEYVFKSTPDGTWETSAKATVGRKKGTMNVQISAPSFEATSEEDVDVTDNVDSSTPEEDSTPKPFFWTCPGYNAESKPFDRIRKDYNELTGPERELYIQAGTSSHTHIINSYPHTHTHTHTQ
jgi:hypothetical protein